MRGIVKHFGDVVANDGVDFAVAPATIHALLGENGAGKTTLMRILYGLAHPDEGEVRIGGERVEIRSPKDAIRAGIGMVTQHFSLVAPMTVAENCSATKAASDSISLRRAPRWWRRPTASASPSTHLRASIPSPSVSSSASRS
jgi:simple sugar transport system ATP-binding protein